MTIPAQLPKSAADELIEMASFMAAPWAASIFSAWAAHSVASQLIGPGITAGIAAGVTLLATAFILLQSMQKRNAVGIALLRWRHVVLLGIAFAAGTEWQSYSRATSDEGRSERAALWACGHHPECIKTALEYGSLKSQYIYIPPRK